MMHLSNFLMLGYLLQFLYSELSGQQTVYHILQYISKKSKSRKARSFCLQEQLHTRQKEKQNTEEFLRDLHCDERDLMTQIQGTSR